MLGITKKEFQDSIIDLVNRKRLSTKPGNGKPVEVNVAHIEEVVAEEKNDESLYMRTHLPRATIEKPISDRECEGTDSGFDQPRVREKYDVNGLTRRVNGRSTPSMDGGYAPRPTLRRSCMVHART